MNAIARIRDVAFRVFEWATTWRRKPAQLTIVPTAAKPESEPKPKKSDDVAGLGVAMDVHDVLDNLPEAFRVVRKIRKADPDAVALLSRIGAPITHGRTLFANGFLQGDLFRDRPIFRGGFVSKDFSEGDRLSIRAVYIVREDSAARRKALLLAPNEITYRLGAAYICDGIPWVGQALFALGPDNVPRLIVEPQHITQRITHHDGRGSHSYLTHTYVGIPQWLNDYGDDNKRNARDAAHGLFCAAASLSIPDNTILVRATDGKATVAWAIDRRDAKRFFRKRETDAAADGRRKRVLHYVAPHTRETSDGKTVTVRAHYRGERQFKWGGYTIRISGLGTHHRNFLEAPIEPVEEGTPGTIETDDLMKRVAREYDADRRSKRMAV